MTTSEINSMINLTSKQFDAAINGCKDIFFKKLKDYGTAWRILRISSITDQIFIKAQRIRSIDEKGTQKVAEGIVDEFKGIVNYAIIGLIQLELENDERTEIPQQECENLFNKHVSNAKSLMQN